ncbi:MFS transporter [Parvibaculum sp.]|uniref:MFS transporter n=1 Tax=Parvibaculum sp. TaxID=2024848 RepID=UPI001B1FCA4E|nr:MFS transporter [Parvibaculum sp.]MBO6669744.1 MFS transporter [Parvibaculum sp.]MBO6693530.1 MFS transporter [Parvibaculum sp.]MBO6716243.1 MFS transporter [Parvibaculum sp.]|tara:strand:- start:774 stop:2144 length:1371 start_codon:yes stop_codon:yes gene_type:complete
MSDKRLSPWRLAAFSGPAIPIAALGLPIGVYLPQFYAGPMGLGLAAVGTIFMLLRFWDVITDPLMGIISDRYTSRWGRRRHWIVLSVPLLVICAYMAFVPTAPVTSLYLFGWMFFLYIGWTMLTISHMAWAAELSDDYNERSRIQGYREAFQLIGVPLVLLIPAIIEQMEPENMEAARVASIGWFIVATLPIAVAINVFFVPERKSAPQPPIDLIAATRAILRNLPLRRLLAADFLSGFAGAALASMYIYEATYVWGIGSVASFLLLLYFFGGIIFIPVVLKLSYRLGKHRTVVAAGLFNVVFPPVIFLIPEGNYIVASFVLLFLGVNIGTTTTLYRSMMADVADIDALETGQRRTGLFYALLTLTQKLGGAVAVGVVFWTLALIGFVPEPGANTEATLTGLSIVFVATPVICNALVAAIMWKFPIGIKEQEELRRQLAERFVEEIEQTERPPNLP